MDRRSFLKTTAIAGAATWLAPWQEAWARGKMHAAVGKAWQGWEQGEFQVHFIYTGVAESMFFIMPDGTTMLLDCGDHNAIGRGKLAVPVLPHEGRHAGEWIARYVERVNPNGRDVDYMMLSHYHNDHGGCSEFCASKEVRDGREYALSGFSQAAETLHFHKAFDRCWPDYNDPIPLVDKKGADNVEHMKFFYEEQIKKNGLAVEKFQVGAINQVALLRNPRKYPRFSVRNITGNGRIAFPDGHIVDLYAERKKNPPVAFNENGMSLGMIFSYGPFRFYTAGDFSDAWKLEDGTRFEIEDALAEAIPSCHVAKINHHGHYSMPRKLVAALRSQVYVSCVWDQLHDVAPVMERLYDQSIYQGERYICPGIFPKERREEDQGKPFLSLMPEAAFEGGHVILTVAKGGKTFTITYLSAQDESMTVCAHLDFETNVSL